MKTDIEIHSSVSPVAAALLYKTAELITAHPERYKQGTGLMDCGSPCCIIGQMKLLTDPKAKGDCEYIKASSIGLTQDQLHAIYWPDEWPGEHCLRGNNWNATPEQGVARIEHFLRTGA